MTRKQKFVTTAQGGISTVKAKKYTARLLSQLRSEAKTA